jgi:Concanavalin A-like lectin/glucanases superfamily
MRKEYVVAAILAATAVPVGLPMMVAPQLFPDLSRPVLWLLFLSGPIATVGMFLLAAFVATDRDPAAHWRRKASGFKGKVIRRSLMAGAAIVGVLVWYFLPLDPLRNELPGFTAYTVLSLQNQPDRPDQPDSHRKYVYVFGPAGASHAEFYLSASGEYTFSVTDLHGEQYPLETNIGDDGIPLNKFIALFSQVALTKKSTILRLSVNGKEIIRRTLPFVINIPPKGWSPNTIGADQNGNNNGSFLLMESAAWGVAISNSSISGIWANTQKTLKL